MLRAHVRRMCQQAKKPSHQHGAPTTKQQVAPLDHVAYTWANSKDRARKHSWWFKYAQAFFGLAPIPIGCYLLCASATVASNGTQENLLPLILSACVRASHGPTDKAISSFNRSPPPIATDSGKVLSRPLYPEPVYQKVSFAPSTFAKNMTSRSGER